MSTPTTAPASTPIMEFEDNWSKGTETKAPEKPVRVAVPVNKDIIEEEPEEEVKKDPPAVAPAAAAPAKPAGLSASLSAEMTTMAIDTFQTIPFGLINNRKLVRRIGKENIERFEELLTELIENKKKPENLSEADFILFLKFKRLKKIEEEIPLSKEESDKLTEILDKYYTETGKSMPAWLGLSIALFDVLGARLSDAITE